MSQRISQMCGEPLSTLEQGAEFYVYVDNATPIKFQMGFFSKKINMLNIKIDMLEKMSGIDKISQSWN